MSLRLSPLLTDEPLAEKLITSADKRLAAVSKLILVLVESSKKRLTTVFPRNVGSFLFGPSVMIASSFAVDKIPIALSFVKSSIDRRWPVII